MTDHPPARLRAFPGVCYPLGSVAALLLSGLLVQGCTPPAPAASTARVYAADVQGAARDCKAPNVAVIAGQTTDVPVTLGNDGGWCGVLLHQPGPKPFDAGLLTSRPGHGTVLIHEVGDDTRIDYTPDRSFTGSDTFTVKLLPGEAVVRETVTVAAGAPKVS